MLVMRAVMVGKTDKTAANLLREARSRRRMTQRELAKAAGVKQSVVARIETGSRQPSVPTLIRLITAAGFDLHSTLSNTARPSQLVVKYRDQLRELGEDYGINRIRVFGSVARGEDRPNSDLDLLIDLASDAAPLAHLGFAEAAENLLGCHVDAVTTSSLHEMLRSTVLAEAQDLEQA